MTALDGTVTETVAVRYTQNWTAYNLAQTYEKERLADLLKDLCSGIPNPVQRRGSPRLPLSDVIFAAAIAITDAGSRRELFVSALTLLRWAAREVAEGRKIVAVDDGTSREIVLPLLEGLRRVP